ncbi:MAG: 30S ribosomal protein S8 [Elusimicrobia bacterium]|nr:30S ribosomal protein S8 [Elusimicrobiota bacterium]
MKIKVSGELRLDGVIIANGTSGRASYEDTGGGGSGGGIYITANKITGSGEITSNGGAGSRGGRSVGGGGGGGRIGLYYADGIGFTGKVKAYGGYGDGGQGNGGAGTIIINGVDLYIDNNNLLEGKTTLLDGSYSFAKVEIRNIGRLTISSANIVNVDNFDIKSSGILINKGEIKVSSTLSLENSGKIYHDAGTIISKDVVIKNSGEFNLNHLYFKAENIRILSGGILTYNNGEKDFNLETPNLIVEAGGKIDANGKGYPWGGGPGRGVHVEQAGSGGGYGGNGGNGYWRKTAIGGKVYGSIMEPGDMGSGGGYGGDDEWSPGGSGGGLLKIKVSGELRLDGVISANGTNGRASYIDAGAGGSGGGIYITANKITGSGEITSNGGAGSRGGSAVGGGGGGGRIALYYADGIGFTGKVKAYGGYGDGGQGNGGAGSIIENGRILSMTEPTIESPNAVSNTTETIGKETELTETLIVEKVLSSSLITTGTLQGVVNFSELEIVKIKTGSFQGSGLIRGKWFADLNNINYIGDLKGVVFTKQGRTYIKGTLINGVFRGVVEGEINGTNLQFRWNFNQLGAQITSGKLYLSGIINQSVISQEYPQTQLKLTQKNIQGQMNGYVFYSGNVNAVFTHIKFGSGSGIYKNEGIFTASYETTIGNAQGWSYTKEIMPGITTLEGLIDNPIYGLMSGALNEYVIPKSLLINLERVDTGLPLETDLRIRAIGPDTASPGGILAYSIQITNNGLKAVENMTAVAIAPQHTDFISASGNYAYYNVARWINDQYAPTPFIRWDLPVIEPKTKIELNYQSKVRIGVAGPHELLEGNAYIVPKTIADDIFAGFTYKNIPKIRAAFGVTILSTPKGILADSTAKKEKVGGEVLCQVW